MWDVESIRRDFPILKTTVHGRPLVYLDNSATTHKPRPVLQAVDDYYTRRNSNVHRSAHYLSQLAGEAYEDARRRVGQLIHAGSSREVVFTSGTTESINLVAHCFADPRLGPDNNIVVTEMEHHSNLVPWQMLCKRHRAELRVIPIRNGGTLDIDRAETLITPQTTLLAVTHVSNVLGTCNPLEDLVRIAHSRKVPVLVDGAQAIARLPVDVRQLRCDFYAFSGHKLYAETGIGVLYIRPEWLDHMTPWLYGGGMIGSVTLDRSTFAEPPYRFEAGTRNTAAAVSLAAAIDYLHQQGWEDLLDHEQTLLQEAIQRLEREPDVTVYGTDWPKCGVISFNLDGLHSLDVASILDKLGIAVRSGHHCAEPLMQRLGVTGTVRASFACYNIPAEIDILIDGLQRVRQMLR
jgi:cysteine desulfurase/selenocysteine lyase